MFQFLGFCLIDFVFSPPTDLFLNGDKKEPPSVETTNINISRLIPPLPSNHPFSRISNWGNFNFSYSNLANSGLLPKLVYFQPTLNPFSILAGTRNPLNGGFNPSATPIMAPHWNPTSAAAAALLLTSAGSSQNVLTSAGSSQNVLTSAGSSQNVGSTGEKISTSLNSQVTSFSNRHTDAPTFSPRAFGPPYSGLRVFHNAENMQERKHIFSPMKKYPMFSPGAENIFSPKYRLIHNLI